MKSFDIISNKIFLIELRFFIAASCFIKVNSSRKTKGKYIFRKNDNQNSKASVEIYLLNLNWGFRFAILIILVTDIISSFGCDSIDLESYIISNLFFHSLTVELFVYHIFLR